MGKKSKWVVPLVAVVFLGISWAASASAFDQYGTDPYVRLRLGGETTNNYEMYDCREFEWQWYPGAPITGSSWAMGDIRDAGLGTIAAETNLFYHDPFGPGQLQIGADAQTWTWIRVTSDELAEGTMVTVNLDLHYSGSLLINEANEGLASRARVGGLTTLYDSQGEQIDSRRGTASLTSAWGEGGVSYSPLATGDWEDSLSQIADGEYLLWYEDTIFDIEVAVGDRIWVYFDLALLSESLTGSGAGWDGSGTQASAMFGRTGTYNLWSENEFVSFETFVIPEPGTILLFGSGLLGLVGLKRKFRK